MTPFLFLIIVEGLIEASN